MVIKMKKIVCLLLALILCFNPSAFAFAEETGTSKDGIISEAVDPGNNPRAEETMWYLRVTDEGWIQQRLWSITYRKWLTDRITVGHT